MDDLLRVGVVGGERQRADQPGRLGGGLRPAGKMLVEAAAVGEFHGEVGPALVLADFVDLHNIGVPHARRRLRLDAEACPFPRAGQGAVADQFERDQSIQTHLPGLVDDAHPAPAEFFQDLVTGDRQLLRRRGPRGRRPFAGGGGFAHRASSFSRGAPGNGPWIAVGDRRSVDRPVRAYKVSSLPF